MSRMISVLAGDGIGPEIVEQALRVLDVVNKKFDLNIETKSALVGGAAIDAIGEALPKETLDLCKSSDAILFGSVGGPKWENLAPEKRPERGALLPLRKIFKLYANLRPAIVFESLIDASPLKREILGNGFDILIIRELTGGIYFGEPKERGGEGADEFALDTMVYTRGEIERITYLAFEAAMKRNKKLASIDKSNVLTTCVLWREVVEKIAKDYPEVELSHLLVDAAAMKLVSRPRNFDVILAGNMFGDILSDEASTLTGSLGMLPSASLSEGSFGLYEPSHGSAPDIAGQNIANPTAQILSLAMLFRYTYSIENVAQAIELALERVLKGGYRTGDIMSSGCTKLSCSEFGTKVVEAI